MKGKFQEVWEQRLNPWSKGILVGGLIVLVIGAVLGIVVWILGPVKVFGKNSSVYDILTLVFVACAFIGLSVRLFYSQRRDANDTENIKLTKLSNRNARFNSAVSHLTDPKTAIGGVYGLIDLVNEKSGSTEEDAKRTIKVLCSYIRQVSEQIRKEYGKELLKLPPEVHEIMDRLFGKDRTEAFRYVLKNAPGERKEHINLRRAYLCRAELQGANLSFAELTRADLRHAKMNGIDLSGATLSRIKAYKADWTDACLDGADLSNAEIVDDKGVPAIIKAKSARGIKIEKERLVTLRDKLGEEKFKEWYEGPKGAGGSGADGGG